MDSKLERIRELINTKEKVDAELERLLGAETARRGRPPKRSSDASGQEEAVREPERLEEAEA